MTVKEDPPYRDHLLGFLRERSPGGRSGNLFSPLEKLPLRLQETGSTPAARRQHFISVLERVGVSAYDLVGVKRPRRVLLKAIESLRPKVPEPGVLPRAAIDRDPFWGELSRRGRSPLSMVEVLREAGFERVEVPTEKEGGETPGEGGQDGKDGNDQGSTRDLLAGCALGITVGDLAVAETGSVAQFSRPFRPRAVSLLPPAHLVVVPEDRILSCFEDLLDRAQPELAGQQGYLVLITGPSRTADIEKVLTIGVHGPGRVAVVVVEGSVS